MSHGFIDSASLHMIILAMSKGATERWSPWVWESAAVVTTTLWSNPLFKITPGPDPFHGARGEFENLLAALQYPSGDAAVHDRKALESTRRWARENIAKLRRIRHDLSNDPSFVDWLDWYTSSMWAAHSQMHGALFTAEFVPQIARTIDCSEQELRRVHDLSHDPQKVAASVRQRTDSEDRRIAREAFVTATLLRGRYHDRTAKSAECQIIHRPLRRHVLTPGTREIVFDLSNTEQYLTGLILCSALVESSTAARVKLWAENTKKVRDGVRAKALTLDPKPSDRVARDLVLDFARRYDMRFHPRRVEYVVEGGLALFVEAGLLALGLDPWTATALATGEALVTRASGVSEKLAARVAGRRRRLSKLSESGAGRIRSILRRR